MVTYEELVKDELTLIFSGSQMLGVEAGNGKYTSLSDARCENRGEYIVLSIKLSDLDGYKKYPKSAKLEEIVELPFKTIVSNANDDKNFSNIYLLIFILGMLSYLFEIENIFDKAHVYTNNTYPAGYMVIYVYKNLKPINNHVFADKKPVFTYILSMELKNDELWITKDG